MSEVPAPVKIPQPHANLDQELEVPGVFVERFDAVTKLAHAAGEALLPQHVAAAVINDETVSEQTWLERARNLEAADEYLREHPGEPVVDLSHAFFNAGIGAESDGLQVFPWNSTIDYGTGLLIPAVSNVKIEFSGRRIFSFQAESPSEEPLKIVTPETVVTPDNLREVDLLDRAEHGGVLAVGVQSVDRLTRAISDLPHRQEHAHLKKAIRIAMPVLDLMRN